MANRWVGKSSSDIPALKLYWGKPAVRNFRGGDGNVGIIRSPVRAIVLPDYEKGVAIRSAPSLALLRLLRILLKNCNSWWTSSISAGDWPRRRNKGLFRNAIRPEWRCRTSAWLLAYLSVNDPGVTGLSCTKGQTLTEVDHGANPVQIYS